jgi:hypothetical protein
MKKGFRLGVLSACGVLLASQAQGRFHHRDAEEIDREELYSSEAHLDEMSYRPPDRWTLHWDESDVGYHINAGSLTVDRFLYREAFRLRHAAGSGFIAFEQELYQDMVEEKRESSLLAEFPLGLAATGLDWRLLGDSDTFKKWGDLGVGLAAGTTRNARVSLDFWSVDHFYNTKEIAPSDRYERKPWTVDLKASWHTGDIIASTLRVQWDHPLLWHRESQGYDYHYARRTWNHLLRIGPETGWNLQVTTNLDRKEEEKIWFTSAGVPVDLQKSLRRDELDIRVHAVRIAGDNDRDWRIGIESIQRDAHTTDVWRSTGERRFPLEGRSPSLSRRELALMSTHQSESINGCNWGSLAAVLVKNQTTNPQQSTTRAKDKYPGNTAGKKAVVFISIVIGKSTGSPRSFPLTTDSILGMAATFSFY